MTADRVSFDLFDESQTEVMGQCIAQFISAPFVICLKGTLGAGKTALVRAILRAMNVKGPIKSPTFSVVESYDKLADIDFIHHFDLYRITDIDELEMIGFRDYFSPRSICFIEWPDRAEKLLNDSYDILFELIPIESTRRVLYAQAITPKGQHLLSCLLRAYG